MDNADPSKSAVGLPFIAAANALANLYKKAATVEKDSRDLGTRAAYMKVLEWAARKSSNNEKITTAELITLCSDELAKVPAPPSRVEEDPSVAAPRPLPYESRQQRAPVVQQHAAPVSGGEDTLASDIKKLAVNPRKRQRTSISETFIRACQESGNASLFSMGSTHNISPRRDFEADSDNRDARGSGECTRKTRSVRNSFIEKQRRK